jgi:hypothetical protein
MAPDRNAPPPGTGDLEQGREAGRVEGLAHLFIETAQHQASLAGLEALERGEKHPQLHRTHVIHLGEFEDDPPGYSI